MCSLFRSSQSNEWPVSSRDNISDLIRALCESNLHSPEVFYDWYNWNKELYDIKYGEDTLTSEESRRLMTYRNGLGGTTALRNGMPHMPRNTHKHSDVCDRAARRMPPPSKRDAPREDHSESGEEGDERDDTEWIVALLKATEMIDQRRSSDPELQLPGPEEVARTLLVLDQALAAASPLGCKFETLSPPDNVLSAKAMRMLEEPRKLAEDIFSAFVTGARTTCGVDVFAAGEVPQYKRALTDAQFHGYVSSNYEKFIREPVCDISDDFIRVPGFDVGPAPPGTGQKRLTLGMQRVALMRGLPGLEDVINFAGPGLRLRRNDVRAAAAEAHRALAGLSLDDRAARAFDGPVDSDGEGGDLPEDVGQPPDDPRDPVDDAVEDTDDEDDPDQTEGGIATPPQAAPAISGDVGPSSAAQHVMFNPPAGVCTRLRVPQLMPPPSPTPCGLPETRSEWVPRCLLTIVPTCREHRSRPFQRHTRTRTTAWMQFLATTTAMRPWTTPMRSLSTCARRRWPRSGGG